MNSLEQHLAIVQSFLADSFDVSYRYIDSIQKKGYAIFLSSLSSGEMISNLIESIVITAERGNVVFYPGSVSFETDVNTAIISMLSGQCMILLEDDPIFYIIETRSYPSRMTAEPKVEQSIRGAHDGFVENIILNIGLIRRRIRDPKLRIILNKEGSKTKTDIAYAYIEHLVDPDILSDFEKRLASLDKVEIISERYLCEALYGKTMNPYPHVRYCERPDVCAIHLLEGYLVVIVDNSPCAMIIPTTFFELSKQMEEYTQTSVVALNTRLIRILGIFISLYLLPLWCVLIRENEPTILNLPVVGEITPLSFGFQVFLAEIVVEWMRMALIHTPSILSSIMGFIAVFVMGDMTIELGAYTKEILVMVAVSNLGNLVTPNYELSMANKVVRVILCLAALFFGVPGFCIGIIIHFTLLVSTKTIKFPYLYPLIPFSYKEIGKLLFGTPIKIKQKKKQ